MIEPHATEQTNLQQSQPSPIVAPQAVAATGEFVRPTHVARARNRCLANLLWLPVAGVVGGRALTHPAISTAWIAIVVALSAVWMTIDAIGARVVDRVVLVHGRVSVRAHTALGVEEFEITDDDKVEMEYTSSRRRRHRYIELWWPHDGPRHTIRLDVYSKHDQAKILRRVRELTSQRPAPPKTAR
jgi:hypothetical protein